MSKKSTNKRPKKYTHKTKKNTKKRSRSIKKCPEGKIFVEGYTRKAHYRKSYTRNGTKVENTYVDRTKVPGYCVKDRGEKGKTPESKKILPKPTKNVLGPFGYSINKTAEDRHKALKKASKYYNTLEILRHLNLVRNYQPDDSRAHKIMSRDVNYMSKLYDKVKRK